MKKLILALTALSLAAAFTACRSTKEETVENRLNDAYGWQGGTLPQAAPDPQTVITAPEDSKTEPKDAGIVSTVDIKETVLVIDEQPPVPPAGKEGTAAPSDGKKPSVKVPSNVKYELTGETKTHVVKKGETLSSIAKAEYKNGHLWGFIFKANKELLNGNPNLIKPGMKITVPLIREVSAAKVKAPEAEKKTVAESPKTDAKAKAPEAEKKPVAESPKTEKPAPVPVEVKAVPAAPAAPAPIEKAPEAPKAN